MVQQRIDYRLTYATIRSGNKRYLCIYVVSCFHFPFTCLTRPERTAGRWDRARPDHERSCSIIFPLNPLVPLYPWQLHENLFSVLERRDLRVGVTVERE